MALDEAVMKLIWFELNVKHNKYSSVSNDRQSLPNRIDDDVSYSGGMLSSFNEGWRIYFDGNQITGPHLNIQVPSREAAVIRSIYELNKAVGNNPLAGIKPVQTACIEKVCRIIDEQRKVIADYLLPSGFEIPEKIESEDILLCPNY